MRINLISVCWNSSEVELIFFRLVINGYNHFVIGLQRSQPNRMKPKNCVGRRTFWVWPILAWIESGLAWSWTLDPRNRIQKTQCYPEHWVRKHGWWLIGWNHCHLWSRSGLGAENWPTTAKYLPFQFHIFRLFLPCQSFWLWFVWSSGILPVSLESSAFQVFFSITFV